MVCVDFSDTNRAEHRLNPRRFFYSRDPPHRTSEVDIAMQDTETASGGRQKFGRPTWYITTAIPYVNAPPHIGFALELIQADVLARYRRAEGYDVRFQAGTDENSLKNVQAAEAAGIRTETLVRVNAEKFRY